MNTSIAHILKAPLNHVKRQFIQDCVFVFNGATFLSTPRLLAEVRSRKADTHLIVLDIQDLPIRLSAASCAGFEDEVAKVLENAEIRFGKNKQIADAQFKQLLELSKLEDEHVE